MHYRLVPDQLPFHIESSATHLDHPTIVRLGLLLALYLAAAIAYGFFTPPYEGPDEIGHILYSKHIAEGNGIPVQSREYAIAYGYGQEGSQAPLYYALNAALIRGFNLSLSELQGVPESNPFTTCGQPTGYNVARYRHTPLGETFPYAGAARAVHVMRLLAALLGAVTVAAIFLAARLAFPTKETIAWIAAVLIAFNPQFAFMGGVVNNDNLVNCFTALAVTLTLFGLRRGFTRVRVLAVGILCGIAALGKLGGLLSGVFAAICIFAACWRNPRRFVEYGALCIGGFLATAGWWFVRNWHLYGDPTGTNMMLSIHGGRGGWPAHLVIPELLNTFTSYWASFACELGFPQPVYWVFGLLVVLGLLGWRKGWAELSQSERWISGILLVWLGLVTLFWVRWNQLTYAPLGRLFFQAAPAISLLLSVGLAYLTSRPRLVLAVIGSTLLVLTLTGALFVVRPAFALPERHESASSALIPNPIPDARFGDSVNCLGYDLNPRSLEAGESLEIALFVQTEKPLQEDYAMALQLVSPVPGDDSVLVNFNTLPGGGTYLSTAWQPGEVIADRYRVDIPQEVVRTQAWRVVAILYRLEDGERVPVSVAGQAAGGALGLGLVRVGASNDSPIPPDGQLESEPVFGDAIRLEGLQLDVDEGLVHIRAWWHALAPLDNDYTVLVHVYDTGGTLLANGDTPPLHGGFPTSLWEPGDSVVDEYTLELPPGAVKLGLGWYEPDTGVRLLTNDAAQQGIVAVVIPRVRE
ncbi:MAG: glycosyltransferase family 39 protein [Anaerolineae bacterium]|nr:glycosyltransferase family 39 protein [Anaerolineae bacterium]